MYPFILCIPIFVFLFFSHRIRSNGGIKNVLKIDILSFPPKGIFSPSVCQTSRCSKSQINFKTSTPLTFFWVRWRKGKKEEGKADGVKGRNKRGGKKVLLCAEAHDKIESNGITCRQMQNPSVHLVIFFSRLHHTSPLGAENQLHFFHVIATAVRRNEVKITSPEDVKPLLKHPPPDTHTLSLSLYLSVG